MDSNCKGRGVYIFISSKYAFTKVDQELENIEAVWTNFHFPKSKSITVGTVYRPPKDRTFIEHFEESLSKLKSDNDNIILGDFNICLQNYTTLTRISWICMNYLRLSMYQLDCHRTLHLRLITFCRIQRFSQVPSLSPSVITTSYIVHVK